MKRAFFILLFLFTLIGCKWQTYNIFNGEFRYVKYAGKVESLYGEEVDIDVMGIRRTWIADTLFLVQNPRSDEAFLSIYHLNSHKLLYKNLLPITKTAIFMELIRKRIKCSDIKLACKALKISQTR